MSEEPIRNFKDLFKDTNKENEFQSQKQIDYIKTVVFGIMPKDNSLKTWLKNKNQKP